MIADQYSRFNGSIRRWKNAVSIGGKQTRSEQDIFIMADIRELVPTFLESLSHNALCHNRKRETREEILPGATVNLNNLFDI